MTNVHHRYTFLLSTIVISLFLTSCGEKKEVVESEKNIDFVLVNVLDKEYYDMCHIVGSINIPFDQVNNYALQHWDKEKTEIVTYCTNFRCTASFQAAKDLTKLGFKKVWAYEGGAAEAQHLGLAMEGNNCSANWLQDYEKPRDMQEQTGVNLISFEELQEKINKFAAKK